MFKPTYIYIKQHRVTGLKYLGKTTRTDVLRYPGSGKHWKLHLRAHGNLVDTIWYEHFTEQDACMSRAKELSERYDVVRSSEWANLKEENGIDGSLPGQWVGKNSPMYGRKGKDHPAYGRKDTDKTNKARATAKLGSLNPMYGVFGKDHPGSNHDYAGDKNPNHDDQVYVFEHIGTGTRYRMTRHEFKQMGLIYKTGVDRLARGTLKRYKGWQLV